LTSCIYQANIFNNPNLPTNFSDAQETVYRAFLTTVDNVSGWTITQAAKGTDCFASSYDIIVVQSSVGSSGTGSNDVKDYGIPFWTTAGGTAGGLVNLTESGGVAGSYQKWTVCQARVDMVDVLAKGTSSSADQRGMDHAGTHAIAGCLGLGGVPVASDNRATRILFDPTTTATGLAAGESCMLQSFATSSPSNWGNSGLSCAD
jgi:hypothetical protein